MFGHLVKMFLKIMDSVGKKTENLFFSWKEEEKNPQTKIIFFWINMILQNIWKKHGHTLKGFPAV